MLEIVLENAGKRYNRDWIFRGVDYRFTEGESYAITGNNGSGKSTLLQCIAGAQDLKEGKCIYSNQEKLIKPEPQNGTGFILLNVDAFRTSARYSYSERRLHFF